jgi:hypothetical protein
VTACKKVHSLNVPLLAFSPVLTSHRPAELTRCSCTLPFKYTVRQSLVEQPCDDRVHGIPCLRKGVRENDWHSVSVIWAPTELLVLLPPHLLGAATMLMSLFEVLWLF